MSNFKDSANVNHLAGNLYNGGWEAIEHQRDIIASEVNELFTDGIEDRNIHEIRDGIADVLFTTYGLAHRMGVDANVDYADMMKSQWTKFDTTEEEALKTKAKYDELGIETCYIQRSVTVERDVTMDKLRELANGDEDIYGEIMVSRMSDLINNPVIESETLLLYVTLSAKQQLDARQRPIPPGKWLKSYKFQEPVYGPLPAEVSEKLGV